MSDQLAMLAVCEKCGGTRKVKGQYGQPMPCPACQPPDVPALGPIGKRPTSRKAALDNYPRSGTQRYAILRYVVAAGEYGATDDEIQQALDMRSNSENPRRGELAEGGWIEETERTRRTRSGSEARVWVATEKARREVATREGAA